MNREESHSRVSEDSLVTVPLARNRHRPLIEVYGTCGESAAHMVNIPAVPAARQQHERPRVLFASWCVKLKKYPNLSCFSR